MKGFRRGMGVLDYIHPMIKYITSVSYVLVIKFSFL